MSDSPSEVPGSRGRSGARRSIAIVLGVAVASALLVFTATMVGDRRSGDAFDLVRWERNTFAGKWLYALGAPLRSDVAPDEAIARYFAAPIGSAERRRYENDVEAAMAGRIDAAARDRGLTGALPIPASVFPPVNIELTQPPRVLVRSPRRVIERTGTDLLRPDLTAAEVTAIERAAEVKRPDESVLVVGSGGVATYPAIVVDRSSYSSTVETAAHEWTHHYLQFYPLGLNYFRSRDTTTINETVADIVGEELAADILARWGDPTVAARRSLRATVTPTSTPTPPALDANAVLRDLRREVDALLAGNSIEQAEARMEAVRLQLWDAGYRIRRLNQAYFAWYGSYAARPDATDPLGAQLREVRARTGSLIAFLEVVRGTTSRAEVVAALERLRGSGR